MMSSLLYLASSSQANNTTVITKDGIPIEVIEKTHHGSPEKSNSIIAMIDGYVLTVIFTEDLGQVAIEVTSSTSGVLQTYWVHTPEGIQTYLPNTGDYIVTFTLPSGDEYYGEFTVTE